MTFRRRVGAVSLTLGLALASCGRTPATGLSPSKAVQDQLFFGRNIPSGGTVSDSAWSVFLAEAVTPRLPEGFTVIRSNGQWLGDDGKLAREEGFVLVVSHPRGTPPDSTFEAIALEYVRRFRQDAVFRARSASETWMYRRPNPR